MECQKNGCNREGTNTCRYCHKAFCHYHIRANKPSTPSLSSRYYGATPSDGHPCITYINGSRYSHYSVNDWMQHTHRKAHAISLIKALVITIVLVILSSPAVGLIRSLNSQLNISSLQSVIIFIDFIVILFITLIYDKITAKRKFFLQEVFSSLFVSLLLIFGTLNNPVILVLAFLLLLSGYFVGSKLEEISEYHEKENFVSGTIVFLIVMWIVYLIFANVNTNDISSALSNTSAQITSLPTTPIVQSSPTESVYGVATQVSTSGNGGSATILTSSAGTQTTLTWTNNNGIPNPSFYLEKTCRWTLSGSTLVSITGCS